MRAGGAGAPPAPAPKAAMAGLPGLGGATGPEWPPPPELVPPPLVPCPIPGSGGAAAAGAAAADPPVTSSPTSDPCAIKSSTIWLIFLICCRIFISSAGEGPTPTMLMPITCAIACGDIFDVAALRVMVRQRRINWPST